MHGGDALLVILAFFLPPLAVFLKTGCDMNFCINVLLTLLAWLPGKIATTDYRPTLVYSVSSCVATGHDSPPSFTGVIHAWWVVLTNPVYVEVHHHHHHGTF